MSVMWRSLLALVGCCFHGIQRVLGTRLAPPLLCAILLVDDGDGGATGEAVWTFLRGFAVVVVVNFAAGEGVFPSPKSWLVVFYASRFVVEMMSERPLLHICGDKAPEIQITSEYWRLALLMDGIGNIGSR